MQRYFLYDSRCVPPPSDSHLTVFLRSLSFPPHSNSVANAPNRGGHLSALALPKNRLRKRILLTLPPSTIWPFRRIRECAFPVRTLLFDFAKHEAAIAQRRRGKFQDQHRRRTVASLPHHVRVVQGIFSSYYILRTRCRCYRV